MIYYRYTGRHQHDSSHLEGGCKANTEIQLAEYVSVKNTPMGCWIVRKQDELWSGAKRRFILTNARKKFAYPDKELAWESFLIRSHYRIQYLESQLEGARAILSAAENREGE